jgi:hypothetical protein
MYSLSVFLIVVMEQNKEIREWKLLLIPPTEA